MPNYLSDLQSRRVTPQTQPIPGEAQVKNSAGGYVYQISPWQRLDRFLILGSEGGTYYASQSKLTQENAAVVHECLDLDPERCVERIVQISDSGRAPKNEPAILALALAAAHPKGRPYAYFALRDVCRIPTHLFHFLAYTKKLRGWSAGLRRAVAAYYTDRSIKAVAFHAMKYKSRDGWSHRDVLRLSHPKAPSPDYNNLYAYIAGKPSTASELPPIIKAVDVDLADASTEKVCAAIEEHRLTHEMIPTELKTNPKVWAALLPHMPLGAMLWNLGNMTRIGLLERGSDASIFVAESLRNVDSIRASRLHPLNILVALKTYAQGHGMRGGNTWNPVPSIVEALDDAFYLAFGNIQPTGKRQLIACDVSGSMSFHGIAGLPISPREATAALAMVAVRTEGVDTCEIIAISDGLYHLPLTPRQRLDDVIHTMSQFSLGRTDCSLPMVYAAKENKIVDAFTILTDNETWYGQIHPIQALNHYRSKTGRRAKLAVVGMTSTGFSIADPNDTSSLDVVGFDTATPQILADFIGQ